MIKYISAQLEFTETSLSKAFELTHRKRHDKYPVKEGDNPIALGLGWIITTKSDGDIYWHNGGTGGYRTYMGFNKSMRKGVVVLATGDDPSDIGAYLMYSDSLKEFKRSLSTELAHKIDLQGVESAKMFFESDGDPWPINAVLHPIYGSEAYLSARTWGHNPAISFLFAVTASLTWEYLIESWFQRPSLIDLTWTPFAGAVLGEFRYLLLQAASKKIDKKFPRVLVMTLLDPFGQLERAILKCDLPR